MEKQSTSANRRLNGRGKDGDFWRCDGGFSGRKRSRSMLHLKNFYPIRAGDQGRHPTEHAHNPAWGEARQCIRDSFRWDLALNPQSCELHCLLTTSFDRYPSGCIPKLDYLLPGSLPTYVIDGCLSCVSDASVDNSFGLCGVVFSARLWIL